MEDDNGLELSLGLSCGGSSGKSKIKDASSDPKVDEGGSNRLMGGIMSVADSSFKNFFQTATENQDQKGKQKTAPEMQQQNFWTDLGKCSTLVTDNSNDVQKNITHFNMYRELWASNSKTVEIEEEKSNKRKMPFEGLNFQNKHENVAEYADRHGKNPTIVNLMRNSHASFTTEDACSGVNEDVAESEGSNSWLVSQHEEKSKSSDIPKLNDKYVASESSVGLHGQKESSISESESNQELGEVAYGIPLLQPLTVMTLPYPEPVKVPINANAPNAIGSSSPCAIQPLPVTNSERPAVQAMNTSNLQLSFGYSLVQLPTRETGSSWAFNPPVPRRVTSMVSRDGGPNTEHSDDLKASHVQAPRSSSSGKLYEDKSLDLAKGGNHVAELGSFPQNEDQSKGTFPFFRQEKTNQSVAEGISHEGSTIRPGNAPDVKFAGSGSYPDMGLDNGTRSQW